jgi:transportin-3
MAAKREDAGQPFAPVLAAVATMQGNASRPEKTQAHEFLEKFQKSVRQTFTPGTYVLFLKARE